MCCSTVPEGPLLRVTGAIVARLLLPALECHTLPHAPMALLYASTWHHEEDARGGRLREWILRRTCGKDERAGNSVRLNVAATLMLLALPLLGPSAPLPLPRSSPCRLRALPSYLSHEAPPPVPANPSLGPYHPPLPLPYTTPVLFPLLLSPALGSALQPLLPPGPQGRPPGLRGWPLSQL